MRENSRKNQEHSDKDQLFLASARKRDAPASELMVSVIVINHDAGPSLERTLETLFKQQFCDFETMVIAENTEDNTVRDVLERWPQIIVLRDQENLGFCRSANRAAKIALGKYLMFLDNKAWLNEKTLGKLVELLESEPDFGIAGPLILNANGSLQSIGMNINQLGRPTVNQKPFNADTDFIDNVFFVPGSALMIEEQLFTSLNGFDELYVKGLEDADLCWRARLMGRKIVVNPWSIAFRNQDEQTDSVSYLKYRNSLRMLIKNYGTLRALTSCADFTKATMVKSVQSLVSSKPRVFLQYWRALIWNLIMLPDSIRQRHRVQKRRRLSDKSVLKNVLPKDDHVTDSSHKRAA